LLGCQYRVTAGAFGFLTFTQFVALADLGTTGPVGYFSGGSGNSATGESHDEISTDRSGGSLAAGRGYVCDGPKWSGPWYPPARWNPNPYYGYYTYDYAQPYYAPFANLAPHYFPGSYPGAPAYRFWGWRCWRW